MKAEKYWVDHALFEGIEFASEEAAIDAAERLAEFLIRNTDRREAAVYTLQYGTEDGETRWWHHNGFEARIEKRDGLH